jgi:hypothetical protein
VLLLHPYYLVNALVLTGYLVVRGSYENGTLDSPDRFLGMTREVEIAAIAFIGAANRSRKLPTLEAIVNHFVLFFHTTIVVLLFFREKRLMTWAIIAFCVVDFVLPKPKPAAHDDVEELTRHSHDEIVKRAAKGTVWIVFYYKSWSDNCNNLRRTFADVAQTYTIEGKLRFAVVDVSAELSERLTINCSGLSNQLPTLILYDGGDEVKRLPPIRDGQVVKTLIDKPGIIAYFGLDRRFAALAKSKSQ